MKKLHLHVTTRCLQSCRHCSVDAGPHRTQSITIDTATAVMEWAVQRGVQSVEISGGEPLVLGRRLLRLITSATAQGLYVTVLSNGTLLNRQRVHALDAAGVHGIGISLYGATASTHDSFTQTRGSFAAALRGVRNVASSGIETVANIIVTPQNLSELSMLPQRLPDVDLYTFASVVPSGRGAELAQHRFTAAEYSAVIHHIEAQFSTRPHLFLCSLHPHPSGERARFCPRPLNEVVVTPEGTAIPCCLLPRRLQPAIQISEAFDRHTAKSSVFSWLQKGHAVMRQQLGAIEPSHNLCVTCIRMLDALATSDPRGDRDPAAGIL